MARGFVPSTGDRSFMQRLPDSADDLPERVVVDLDNKDPDYDFEVVEVDDTPEADRGRPTSLDPSLDDQEEDLRAYSAKAQKRISRLSYERHTERRRAEQMERERDAAAALAKTYQDELAATREKLRTGGTALAASMKAEREARLEDARRRYAAAHADGDSEALSKASLDMATASAELTAITARTPRADEPAPRTEPQQRQPAPAPQQAPTLAPNVAAWIAHNDRWFNRDKERTTLALALHGSITARGIRPDTQEYTRELDKGIRAVYPDHEPYDISPQGDGRGGSSTPRRTNAVAEGSRETRSQPSPRTVELTNSELSIAKRLGLTPQKYAAAKLKRMQQDGDGA